MNKPQAMLVIARINKCSKLIQSANNEELVIDIEDLEDDLKRIASDSRDLKSYVTSYMTEKLAENIEDLAKASVITGYIKNKYGGNGSQQQKKSAKNHVELLKKLADSITYMKKVASTFRTLSQKDEYTGLVEDFQTPDGLEAFKKAVKKGFLKPDYTPNNLTHLQMRYLATALGQYSHLIVRHRLSAFKQQWGDNEFRHAHLTLQEDKVIKKIKATYPDTDFSVMTKIYTENYFEATNSKTEILTLFMALIMNRFVDPRTKYEDFLKIFRIGDMSEKTKINWIGMQKELVAFVYFAFNSTNRRLWGRTCQCFVINGKPINRPTLVGQCNIIMRTQSNLPYFKKLKAICDEFNKNVIL